MKHKLEWTIGTIIAILGILVAAGVFNSANVILVRQINSDYTCPTGLYSSFEVSFANKGNKDTSICVSLTSPNENVSFVKNNDCLYIGSNEQTLFKLNINESSISRMNNITIKYNYIYKKWFFNSPNNTVSCFYSRTDYWQTATLKSQN